MAFVYLFRTCDMQILFAAALRMCKCSVSTNVCYVSKWRSFPRFLCLPSAAAAAAAPPSFPVSPRRDFFLLRSKFAAPRVRIYTYSSSEEEKFLTSLRWWLGCTRDVYAACKGPVSAATIVAQRLKERQARRNSLGLKCLTQRAHIARERYVRCDLTWRNCNYANSRLR